MSTQEQDAGVVELPSLPVDHADWISYVASHTDTSMHELIAPYKDYDSKLRTVFAQHPKHPAIQKSNVVPLYTGSERQVKIRARDLATESKDEKQRYLMPLKEADRKSDGSPAIVESLKAFQTNFQLFSESSLVDMDWSNVVVAGSAVVTSLLPVPAEYNTSKRALREYYHQKLAPASDVDLFLYDLTEEQAVEKIKQIEQSIKDSILTETTTVRTKNAITIASQYPTRHVQIVLRIYRSVSEILTGFDVDCSCAAYDGSQVYASPRALAAYMTQVNTIDLTRRSPSYENRLSKYSRRGFEVYWPLLDRSRIDPTLFERSFGRTLGLARLLVLEKLPNNADREAYVDQRRAERGRPAINRWGSRKLKGNMKEEHDDDVAEWVETGQISDYHTFTIPYGPKYHARKIERLLYAKDLLLNAEWNRPKERETTLHRHPAFFGNAVDVLNDCCGYCPKPETPEDQEIADEEAKTYVSGDLSFIKDDPGRQAIGSFNPLTDDDWTEMAYVGNTARLCQAIIHNDLDGVRDWLSQEGADPNTRDYTGRTPLHLAVTSSTSEIVQCLIDAGARIVARLVDGKTALHLAAMRGEATMVTALLNKSEANEEVEAEKEALKKAARRAAEKEDSEMLDVTTSQLESTNIESNTTDSEDDDISMVDHETENADVTTENSIVRVDHKHTQEHEHLPDDNAEKDDPDVYDVNVLSWDAPVSALHLAIANGHTEVVRVLVQDFGADILLPIKLLNSYNKSPRAAILPLVLALQLPPGKAEEMTKMLVGLGASPAQADLDHVTALQYFAAHGSHVMKAMIAADRPAAQRAAGHLSMSGYQYGASAHSVLQRAVQSGDPDGVEALLELGAEPEVSFATYIKSYKTRWDPTGDSEHNQQQFRQNFQQPVLTAVECELPGIALKLLDAGADVNTLNTVAWRALNNPNNYDNNLHSMLDIVRQKVKALQKYLETGKVENNRFNYGYHFGMFGSNAGQQFPPVPLKDDEEYLKDLEPGSYAHWTTMKQLEAAKSKYKWGLELHEKWKKEQKVPEGTDEKKSAVKALLTEFENLESKMLKRNAKTFKELHPDVKLTEQQSYNNDYRSQEPESPKAWSPKLTFRLPDLTDERRDAYLKLFQACWDADIATVKELCLAVWANDQSPLQIAVQDTTNFSPFSIAVLRKHVDLARAILEIAHAQYAPEEVAGQTKYSVRPTDEDDDSSDDENNDEEIRIYSEIVDDHFTLENIGEVQSKVKSKISPLSLLSWPCPVTHFLSTDDIPDTPGTFDPNLWSRSGRYGNYQMRSAGRSPHQVIKHARNMRTYRVQSVTGPEYIQDVVKPQNLVQLAIFQDDPELLHFLIAMGEDYSRLTRDDAKEDVPAHFRFEEQDFLYAIRLGRVQLLEEIIRRTGVGIPLDDLVKKSGVQVTETPKYYQGLSVHGKKRADWANAGRDQSEPAQEQHPPLLHAARLGSLESVEWFLGNAPLRCYTEFADSNRNDIRIQNLAKAKGGIEASITNWLNLRSNLLLQCVIMGKTDENSLHLLQHLCKTTPESVQQKPANGVTPLQLAFSFHRVEMIKVLLEAGADQTCRNQTGGNIVHSLVSNTSAPIDKRAEIIRGLLNLIDIRLLPTLFSERTSNDPGAATPLASWIFANTQNGNFNSYNNYNTASPNNSHLDNILKVLLEFSKGEDLATINGEGDTPLHAAVRYGADSILRVMLDCRPDLLFRENATGRTPYEMAEDAYLAKEVFQDPPALTDSNGNRRRGQTHMYQQSKRVLDREPHTFVEQAKWRDERSGMEKVWEVCKEFEQKAKGTKRNLVSLVEASEVARRLAARKATQNRRVRWRRGQEQQDGEEDEETKGNEVTAWSEMAMRADLSS